MKLQSKVLMTLIALSAFSCGEESTPSIAERTCSKLQSCNALNGESLAGCVENVERNLAQLPSAARSDTENAINNCLGLNDCSNFLACPNF